MEEIESLLGGRAALLDWDQRSVWPRLDLGPRIFRLYAFFYGPQPFALAHSLPIALQFPRFRKPVFFVLGDLAKNHEADLVELKNSLLAKAK